MVFSTIKPKIKNLGEYKTLGSIKRDGLRVCYNRASDSYWLIEREFLRPVIKSPRECKSIVIKPEDLKHKIFMCRKNREELRGSSALRYIEWGESRGFDKAPTVSNRTLARRGVCKINMNNFLSNNFFDLLSALLTFLSVVFAYMSIKLSVKQWKESRKDHYFNILPLLKVKRIQFKKKTENTFEQPIEDPYYIEIEMINTGQTVAIRTYALA